MLSIMEVWQTPHTRIIPIARVRSQCMCLWQSPQGTLRGIHSLRKLDCVWLSENPPDRMPEL